MDDGSQWRSALEAARRAARSLGADESLADEVAAIAVKRIWSRYDQLAPKDLDAYAAQTARRVLVDLRRRQARVRKQPLPQEWEEATAIGAAFVKPGPSRSRTQLERWAATVHITDEMLATLSARHRALLLLDLEGVPAAQMAQRLGYASANSVRVSLHRIYARLREEFGGRFDDDLLGP